MREDADNPNIIEAQSITFTAAAPTYKAALAQAMRDAADWIAADPDWADGGHMILHIATNYFVSDDVPSIHKAAVTFYVV
jgi:hypothetical protein